MIFLWKKLETYGTKWKIIFIFVFGMVTFTGEYPSKVDDKGRLVMPSALRKVMPEDADMRFVVKRDIFSDCLQMYTFEEWQRRSEEVRSKLNFFNEDHCRFWREFMRNLEVVEPDPKFGRISISSRLLGSIGVSKDVIFSGSYSWIEIWDKDRYEASALTNEEVRTIAGKLSQER